ncbi:hypothetical protein Hanom_Chr17g01572611 [Helianthus anomalus]
MSYQALPLAYVNYLVEWYCLDCGLKQGYTRFTDGSCPNFVKLCIKVVILKSLNYLCKLFYKDGKSGCYKLTSRTQMVLTHPR